MPFFMTLFYIKSLEIFALLCKKSLDNSIEQVYNVSRQIPAMLYEELKARTSDIPTLEEYNHINAIYMESDSMTKDDAVALWEGLYGKAHRAMKRTKNQIDKNCHDLSWVLDYIWEHKGEDYLILPNGDKIRCTYRHGTLTSIDVAVGNTWAYVAYRGADGNMKPCPYNHLRYFKH